MTRNNLDKLLGRCEALQPNYSVVFALDDQYEGSRDAFLNLFGYRSNFARVTGSYKGEKEKALVCTLDTFILLLKGYPDAIANQESFLFTTRCNKLYAQLIYSDGRPDEQLGSLHAVSEDEAKTNEAWSYRPDMGIYWVAKMGNPDKELS